MRITILGGGSAMGGYLSRAGGDVFLVDVA
jgi:galactokinase/mevalonate kinase-like predicted kinase